ncbi:unnamed protein product [Cochlearia groenlandica]
MDKGQRRFNAHGFRPEVKSDGEREGSDAECMLNMVAYLDIVEEGDESDSEEESGLSLEEENQILVESLLKIQEENKGLQENLAKIQSEHQTAIKEREMKLLMLEKAENLP